MDCMVTPVMPTSSIEIISLSKCFSGSQKRLDIRALDNLSFSCCPGLIYGLIGPNGSGKTTCMRILSGIIHPTTGTGKVAGIALHISTETPDTAMKIILAYLLIGSYAILFWLWKEKRKTRIAALSSAEATKSVS